MNIYLLLRWTDPERMIRFLEEDCGEKILLNDPSGAIPTTLQVYK